MQEYKTFTAALLAAAADSEPRANALKAMEREPVFHQDQSGARTVTFSTPIFTLIIRKDAGAKTWFYRWTWTDTAPVRPVLREFAANVRPYGGGTQTVTVKAYDAAQAAEKLARMGYANIKNVEPI